MTFNDDANIKGGRVSRRGKAGIAIGGGGGLVVLAVVLISAFTGVDLTPFLGGGAGGGSEPGTPLTQCETGADANEKVDCRMQAAATALDDYWVTQVDGYVQPQVVLFEQSVNTGCGQASSAVGPFYCPPDQTIYLDTSFFAQLEQQLGGSDESLAQLYIVGHEWGHHIQNITGGMDGLDLQTTGTGFGRRAPRAAGRLLCRSLDRRSREADGLRGQPLRRADHRSADRRRPERGGRGR